MQNKENKPSSIIGNTNTTTFYPCLLGKVILVIFLILQCPILTHAGIFLYTWIVIIVFLNGIIENSAEGGSCSLPRPVECHSGPPGIFPSWSCIGRSFFSDPCSGLGAAGSCGRWRWRHRGEIRSGHGHRRQVPRHFKSRILRGHRAYVAGLLKR